MAGLAKNTPSPTEIKPHQKSRVLEIAFANGKHFKLPYEFLRVYSPSATVRGHGAGQEVKMSHPFREFSTLWNSCAPRNSRTLPGRQRIGVSPSTLIDPNPSPAGGRATVFIVKLFLSLE